MIPDIAVLHVDDDPAFAGLIREYVGDRYDGISIETVHSAADALAHLETGGEVDCVVSDYEMPAVNGLELLAAVRDRWPELPFILFTGAGSEELAERAITAGVTNYLRKHPGTSQYAVLVNLVRNAVTHHRAETELRQASERTGAQFELLVETVEDYAIFLLDADGRVGTWNRGAEKIKGYTREEILGQHLSVFYPPDDVAAGAPERNLRDAATLGKVGDVGWRVRKDGSKFWADVTITALYEGDELAGYVKITRDNTQRRRELTLLDQNQQLRGHIAALSHDLQTPLVVVRGYVELAVETGELSHLDGVLDGVDRLEELLEYIAKLAAEGQRAMTFEPVPLRDVAHAAWAAVETGDAELVVTDATPVADRSRLQQLLENLFENASRQASAVRVSVGPLDGGFYVEDDGPGIPAADRVRVLEMGFSTRPDGTGVGLAICNQIAESHGWTLTVGSGAEGGARFEVTGVDGV